LDAASRIAEEADESRSQVKRYIRLTNLTPELQDMVDDKKISFNPAVELSYLKPEEQDMFLEAMETAQVAPSLSQAQRMKKLSQQGQLTMEAMEDMLSEDKKAPLDRVVFDQNQIRKYFPKSYTTRQMQEKIIQLLEQWQRKQQRDMER
jgi:ParB family chromosome partitioning protein